MQYGFTNYSYQRYTPKDLLDSSRERESRVLSFRSSETDKLGAAEGLEQRVSGRVAGASVRCQDGQTHESCRHEYGAQSLESVIECAWHVPEMGAEIALRAARYPSRCDDYPENNKSNNLKVSARSGHH